MPLEPYLQDADCTLYCGDVLDVLRQLPDESVHMACTSPPFYGLRDYGTGSWEGGDESCDHRAPAKGGPNPIRTTTLREGPASGGGELYRDRGEDGYRDVCGKCGARRVDQQIGLEATPDEWVARLVSVFQEVRRVLRRDGTLWVEIGDSYNGSAPRKQEWINEANGVRNVKTSDQDAPVRNAPGLKTKDMIGAPWLLAFALRADGWYLRSEIIEEVELYCPCGCGYILEERIWRHSQEREIIWKKPNPMPESVTDRPTVSHSRVFLLAKQPRYFYDSEAIREPNDAVHMRWLTNKRYNVGGTEDTKQAGFNAAIANGGLEAIGRNRRSVWTIPTQPYPEAHFATWPEKLVEPMILAGTSERGVCAECGTPWERVTESSYEEAGRGNNNGARKGTDEGTMAARPYETRMLKSTATTGWQLVCGCTLSEEMLSGELASSETRPISSESVPAIVLDPFAGSGTTLHVARRLGRRSVGIELNPDYCEMAARRLAQQSLFADDPGHEPVLPVGGEPVRLEGTKNEQSIDRRKHGFNERWKAQQREGAE